MVMEKIVKLFPAYLMNPANRETFHPQNFCRLRYLVSCDETCLNNSIIIMVNFEATSKLLRKKLNSMVVQLSALVHNLLYLYLTRNNVVC